MTRAAARLRIGSVVTLRLALAYSVFAMLKHVVPLATLVRWAWRPVEPRGRVDAREIITVVSRIRRRVARGARIGCLQTALVLYRELSRAGVSPHLVMGFARDGEALTGHAWVEVDGTPVAETMEEVTRFARTVAFGERGQRLGPAQQPAA